MAKALIWNMDRSASNHPAMPDTGTSSSAVSVPTPVYNGVRFPPAALGSVFARSRLLQPGAASV